MYLLCLIIIRTAALSVHWVWVIKSILIKEMTPFGLWYLLDPSNTVGIYIHLVLF